VEDLNSRRIIKQRIPRRQSLARQPLAGRHRWLDETRRNRLMSYCGEASQCGEAEERKKVQVLKVIARR